MKITYVFRKSLTAVWLGAVVSTVFACGPQNPASSLAGHETSYGGRDFGNGALYAAIDADGRRISLIQDNLTLLVHVGGELSYLFRNEDRAPLPIVQLLRGSTLELSPLAGHRLRSGTDVASLTLKDMSPTGRDSLSKVAMTLATQRGEVIAAAELYDEPVGHEITVASYNVENLFDQRDDSRNESYGDYRIKPNGKGQHSNYGEMVNFNGQRMTFTDVKIAGIRQALIGISPYGPDIVGLVEIESAAAVGRLRDAMADLGYLEAVFTEWTDDMQPSAVGQGLLTKHPVISRSMLSPVAPRNSGAKSPRPILKVTLDIAGHPLTVYVNHWKAKSGPESERIAYADALQRDIEEMAKTNPRTDYIIMGDLNSEYNENVVIEPRNNDTSGRTGINDVLRAQGDEVAVLKSGDAKLKYNLHYELPIEARRTGWHEGFEWSAMDHMIIGSGLYDERGVTYIDDSFQVAIAEMPGLSCLFKADGTTNRWRQFREDNKYTRHEVGGYSDHLPIFARFRVAVSQSDRTITLNEPGRPNPSDR